MYVHSRLRRGIRHEQESLETVKHRTKCVKLCRPLQSSALSYQDIFLTRSLFKSFKPVMKLIKPSPCEAYQAFTDDALHLQFEESTNSHKAKSSEPPHRCPKLHAVYVAGDTAFTNCSGKMSIGNTRSYSPDMIMRGVRRLSHERRAHTPSCPSTNSCKHGWKSNR